MFNNSPGIRNGTGEPVYLFYFLISIDKFFEKMIKLYTYILAREGNYFVKVEGIVYFVGLLFGISTIFFCWKIAWFPFTIGVIFVVLSLVGYAMLLYKKLSSKYY